MLKRKIESKIRDHLLSEDKKIMLIDGARQVGKTYIIRHIGKDLFKNFIEINMFEDSINDKLFETPRSAQDFLFTISANYGNLLGEKKDTLIFIDEIQTYPYLITILKFLADSNKYTYIASGSLLKVTLKKTNSIPIGYIKIERMYPLDFEEFIIANGFGNLALKSTKEKLNNFKSLDDGVHKTLMNLFKKYLIVGGLPDVVNTYLDTNNIALVRELQSEIFNMYGDDASKYDENHKLKIKRVFEMIPSNMEKKKKRIVVNKIDNVKGKMFDDYKDEFEYLISSGVALNVQAISNPTFPLIRSASKNLLKLYLNDVGLLTNILYKNNVNAIIQDENSINLGSVYESVVASELKAHSNDLFYYDNRSNGEVDYLINDYNNLSILPIEVKSGKDYTIHSALNKMLSNKEYNIKKAIVLSNSREVTIKNNVIYMPIYYAMYI